MEEAGEKDRVSHMAGAVEKGVREEISERW